MSTHEITSTLWRRRALFAITFAAAMVLVVIITLAVPKVYRATATVYVAAGKSNLDATQSEQLSRTYTALVSNPNTAQAAVDSLALEESRDQLLDKMSFAPVERTQLLGISAEDDSPTEAQRIANGYADVFVARVNEAVAAGQAPSEATVSETAVEPSKAVRPNPPLYIGFGVLLALLLAGTAVLVRERLDRRVQVGRGDDAIAGQPILGRVPFLNQKRAGASSDEMKIARIQRADAIRLLRTNIDLAAETTTRMLTVSSPEAGDGKSTIASQLALTLATDGDSVTLVECDLRRGELGGVALEKRSSPGLAEYLAGEATSKKIVTESSSVQGLRIVWAGSAVAEPGPLLRSERFGELLAWLQRTNDWVILDTPPLGVGDDALVVSSHSDGTLVVVSYDETSEPALERSLSLLRNAHAYVLGIVLNRAPAERSDAYGYLSEPSVRDVASGRGSGGSGLLPARDR